MKKLFKSLLEKLAPIIGKVIRYFKEKPVRFILLLILILAFGLRIVNAGSLPGGISQTELGFLKKFASINESNDLWLGVYFKDGIFLYLGVLFTKIFGFNIISFRLLSAILGTLTVLFAYLFTRDWFNRQTGYFVAFLLAISSWHITLSRNIDAEVLLPLFLLMLFVLANKAFRTKKMIYFILCGLAMGLGLYVNVAFLFAPILFLVTGTYFYFKNKKFITAYLKEISIAIDAYVLVSIPYFISFFKYKSDFLNEFSFNFSNWLPSLGLALQSLFSKGESNFFYNLGAEPLVDPFVGILFLFGVGFTVFHAGRRKNFFLLILFMVMLLPAFFTKDTVIDKLAGVIPAIYIISAVTLNYVSRHWLKTFPFNKTARGVFVTTIVFFFGLSAFYNLDRYFIVWGNSDQVKQVYSEDIQLLKK